MVFNIRLFFCRKINVWIFFFEKRKSRHWFCKKSPNIKSAMIPGLGIAALAPPKNWTRSEMNFFVWILRSALVMKISERFSLPQAVQNPNEKIHPSLHLCLTLQFCRWKNIMEIFHRVKYSLYFSIRGKIEAPSSKGAGSIFRWQALKKSGFEVSKWPFLLWALLSLSSINSK